MGGGAGAAAGRESVGVSSRGGEGPLSLRGRDWERGFSEGLGMGDWDGVEVADVDRASTESALAASASRSCRRAFLLDILQFTVGWQALDGHAQKEEDII